MRDARSRRFAGERRSLARTLIGGVVIATACLPVGAVQISLPDDAVGDPAQLLVVHLTIDPLDEVLAADIDIAYDPRYLEAVSVEKTSLVESFTLTSNLTRPGWIYIALFTTGTVTGGGPALAITFETIQPGCSVLDITRASLNEGGVPAEIDDGSAAIRDPVDRDGDGYTEVGGDCSDRFAWIHPGAAEVCDGADDDCDGTIDGLGVCVCPAFPAPRTVGFWLAACRGSNLEEQIEPQYVDRVNDSATFAEVTTQADICAVLTEPASGPCVEAEHEFMALVLNIASDRLCGAQPLAGGTSGEPDVDGAADAVDGLLSNPLRTAADCAAGYGIAKEINSGQVIPHFLSEEIEIVVSRQGVADVVISWEEPDAAAAGRPTIFRIHRSTTLPPAWSQRGETLCSLWFPDWNVTLGAGSSVCYQVSGAAP